MRRVLSDEPWIEPFANCTMQGRHVYKLQQLGRLEALSNRIKNAFISWQSKG